MEETLKLPRIEIVRFADPDIKLKYREFPYDKGDVLQIEYTKKGHVYFVKYTPQTKGYLQEALSSWEDNPELDFDCIDTIQIIRSLRDITKKFDYSRDKLEGRI